MKLLRGLLVGLLIATVSTVAVSAKAADPSVTVSGVTLSWPATIYQPVSSSQVTMTVSNDSGRVLLLAKYSIKDKFGTQVVSDTKVNVPMGKNAMTSNWYARDIDQTSAPYTITFFIEYYINAGLPNPAPVSAPFQFTSRSGGNTVPAPAVTVTAQPAPAPTVTVTAQPAPAPTVYITNPADQNLSDLVASLKAQVTLLNAKVKKICAAKPKPKGC
jgi:hypothetical protein